jgi:predicted ATPase
MRNERITRVRVEGMRSLGDVTLDLTGGLTVLIGENGSGKSSLIEALEILRRASGESFLEQLQQVHGGVASLLRHGATSLKLCIRIEVDTWNVEYRLTILSSGTIASEWLGVVYDDEPDDDIREDDVPLLIRKGSSFEYQPDDTKGSWIEKDIDTRRLALTSFGDFPPNWGMSSMLKAMRGIDVHLPFDATAQWAQRSRGQLSPLRGTAIIEPTDALSRFGVNLANTFSALKNDFSDAHWRETMDYVRLGLGRDVESINVRADPGGGSIALRVKYAGFDEQLPAFSLSDGTLTYLGFVALYRLNGITKSLIAFDEPETHLHPELLMRVLGFFEQVAKDRPVVLATHSDRLLDGLSDPARSVVLCELDERRATRLVRPDEEALQDWLSDYRGLGDVRSAGHAASILTRRESA